MRRSATGAGMGDPAVDAWAAAGTAVVGLPLPICVPQFRQKRASALTGSPHEGHVAASGVPHASQNRPPGSFSVPQPGHVKSGPPFSVPAA